MPTIKLTDQFGLDVDVQPGQTSALLKYFQQLPSLRFDNLDLSKIGGLTLDQPAIRSLSTGLSFQDPVNLGDGGPTFSVAAGAHASIGIVQDASLLPGQEDATETLQDACYVSFGIDASASADVSAGAGALQFGVSPSASVELASYTRFPAKTGVTLFQAVQQTVAAFAVPMRSTDLADLAAGQICRTAVTGKLTVSGAANLLATVNPLASVALPAPLPAVSVSAGGSASVGVSVGIATGFEIVARKLDTGAVRLGWYHRRGTDVAVTADVSEGISAGVGTTDLFSQVIGLISASPTVDLQELANAGLTPGQAADIQSAVKAAASRKLEIAVSGAFSAKDAHKAFFLYEIVPDALTAESRAAVDRALKGDISGLHAEGLPGVTCVRSVWDSVRKTGLELDVNLLGILNFRSIATLTLAGKVLFEPATGALVITDRATAERIQSTQLNFGADTDKLRHVLAESFLITAAYHCAKQAAGDASLRCSHRFFELQRSTGIGDMSRKLRTGVALGLLSGGDAEPPAGVSDFGRTLFVASTEYDEALVNQMFLDANGAPFARESYESVGRAAIQFLVQEGDDDAVRRRPAIDDGLWNRMKQEGQPGFPSLFPGVAAPLVGAITADYSSIVWWADAMSGTGQQLAKIRSWLAGHPAASPDDPAFQKLRQDLANQLRQVAANTREEFGQPWGLIAMKQLVPSGAGAKILITGPSLVLSKSVALAAASRP